jgi:hypothetical protein
MHEMVQNATNEKECYVPAQPHALADNIHCFQNIFKMTITHPEYYSLTLDT